MFPSDRVRSSWRMSARYASTAQSYERKMNATDGWTPDRASFRLSLIRMRLLLVSSVLHQPTKIRAQARDSNAGSVALIEGWRKCGAWDGIRDERRRLVLHTPISFVWDRLPRFITYLQEPRRHFGAR